MNTLNVAVNELKPEVKYVVEELIQRGKTITMVLEGDIDYDPCIDIEGGLSIVISEDGVYSLTRGENDTLEYIDEDVNLGNILAQV